MAINTSGYVVSYRTPTAPRISVDVQTIAVSEFESAVVTYMADTSTYVDDYRAVVTNKAYAEDRLKKDLCASVTGLTSGGINLEANTIQLHVKADEVFVQAADGETLSYSNGIKNIESKFNSFYSKYYQNDNHTSFILQPEYEAVTVYDAQAVVIDGEVVSSSGELNFIVDIPLGFKTSRTYTNYSGSTGQFKISYDEEYVVNSSITGAWVVKAVGEQSPVIAYSVESDVDSDSVWVSVE